MSQKINLTEEERNLLYRGNAMHTSDGRKFYNSGWYEELPDGTFQFILPEEFIAENHEKLKRWLYEEQ